MLLGCSLRLVAIRDNCLSLEEHHVLKHQGRKCIFNEWGICLPQRSVTREQLRNEMSTSNTSVDKKTMCYHNNKFGYFSKKMAHYQSSTHSFWVVYKGVCLVIAKPNVDQILHSVLPLLPSVTLKQIVHFIFIHKLSYSSMFLQDNQLIPKS